MRNTPAYFSKIFITPDFLDKTNKKNLLYIYCSSLRAVACTISVLQLYVMITCGAYTRNVLLALALALASVVNCAS